ncbi:protein mono-ADP-ribosyltransferase PARP14-like [Engraulis encrasicolus]|uniref:protein mono-ADP-ribosyltransferase PARP14-like n=1 Tax=Engraulis encrasicolus TaxID=184585 RepID=UPI002FD5120C
MAETILELDGLPDECCKIESKLKLHFQNKRKSGGQITELRKHPTDVKKALLVYLEGEDAKKVIEKGVHKIKIKDFGEVTLTVKPYNDEEDVSTPVEKKPPPVAPRPKWTPGSPKKPTTPSPGKTMTKDGTDSAKLPIQKTPEEPCHDDEQLQPEGLNKSKSESNAITVTSTNGIDKETLRMYLEEFSDHFHIQSKGKAQWIVKFDDKSVVQKVLAKQEHDLGISVEVYDEEAVRRRQDPRRFILSGFDEKCPLKVIKLYINSCCKGQENKWESLDDDKILVTFKDDMDVQSFLTRCGSKKCKDAEITATCVEHTDSILVQGDMSEISEDALLLYFSNRKRSGGGDYEDHKWLEEKKSLVITFEDYHVVSKLMEKRHSVYNRDLTVSLFYPSLQKPLVGIAPSSLVTPSDITLPINPTLYDYIIRNEVCKKEMMTELCKLHSNVAFDDSAETSLILSFDAEPQTLLALRLGSKWEAEAKKAAQVLLEKYSVSELPVEPDVWTRIEDDAVKLSSLNATVRYRKEAGEVVVVGLQGDVEGCAEEIGKIAETALNQLEVERNTIEREVKVHSREELDFIWERWHTKITNVHRCELLKDETDLAFVLQGLREQVTKAEEVLTNVKQNVVNQSLQLEPALLEFIIKVGPKKLGKDLAQSNIFVSLHSLEETIQIIADQGDVKTAEDKLAEILKEEKIPLNPEQSMVTHGEDWKDFYESLKNEVKSSNNILNLKVTEADIQVCGYSAVVADVSRKLKGYLEHNKPATEEVALTSVREVEFVDSCMNLSTAPELERLYVTILPNLTQASPSLKITAPSSSIKEAVTVVENKVKAIVKDTFRYPKAGQSKVLEKHKHSLQTKAKDMGCKLYFDKKAAFLLLPPVAAPATNPAAAPVAATQQSAGPGGLSPTSSSGKVIINGVPVCLKKGDITTEAVDVIVNSSNNSLDLDTGVSGAILKAAGKAVQDECKALGTQPSDAVVLTSGGNLSCKHIAHTTGFNTDADITSSIEKVLALCERETTSSLSVPAIGTGRAGIGNKMALSAIVKGVENHLSSTTSTSIKAINLVVFEQNVFDAFSDYFKKKNTKLPSATKHSHRGTLPANEVIISGVRIQVKKGDITTESVKAIVNTTNSSMDLKNGVSGAIFKAAGSSVEQECQNHGGLQGHDAAVTSAGNLQCDFIIHMMGPHSAADATARAQKVLERCEEKGITTVSFPAVGTGGGGVQGQDAVAAMLQGMEDHLSQRPSTALKLIYIVIDRDDILQAFLQGLKHWTANKQGNGDDSSTGGEDSASSDSSDSSDDMSNDKTSETMIGKIKVKVFCGDLTKETTDAIVNSTTTSLDLNSGVSGAILKAAGQTVVDECTSKGTQPSDGVVLTKAGNLATKHIVHMVGQTSEKSITSSTHKVLQLCEASNIKSVAFPALGTGAGNLGATQVAQAMVEAISNFTVDRPKAVKLVHIVIFQAKMLPDFVGSLKKFKKVKPTAAAAAAANTSIASSFVHGLRRMLARTTAPASPPPAVPANVPASVPFPIMSVEVYSTSANDLQRVEKMLNDLLSEECYTQEVTSKHLALFSEQDMKAMVARGQKKEVQILQSGHDKLTVSGKKDDVLTTAVDIQELLLQVQERATREREETRAYETVQWQMADDEVWKPLSSSVSYDIELAHHRKEKKVVLKGQNDTYTVDLVKKTCTDSKGTTRRIKRSLLGDSDTAVVQYPATWTPMGGKTDDIVTLSPTSEEYKKIEKTFLTSSVNSNSQSPQKYQVVQIERIQSQTQWQRYEVLKQAINKKHPAQKDKNERWLYHGTTKDIAQKINTYGFNRSFCGRNATVHGLGTYFAKDAWYSCCDTYSNPDDQGLKYMYRARVLTGSPCKSKGNMKEPDPLDPSNPQAGLHDCAVDNPQNPFIFVVFCDAGAYPDYLIKFKKA